MEPTLKSEATGDALETPRDRHVSIVVETAVLWKKPYPNTPEQDIDDCVAIYDEDGLASGFRTPKRDFETVVYPGKNIRWTIAAQNATRIAVILKSVSHNPTKGNPLYFDHSPLKAGRDGSVEGTIMNIKDLPDDSYTINIQLLHMDTNERRDYPIDPKLKIRAKQ
jgi:hypothetical protein